MSLIGSATYPSRGASAVQQAGGIVPVRDRLAEVRRGVAGDTLGDLFNVDGAFAYLPQFLEARAQDLTEYLSGDAILEYPFLANLSAESWRGPG